MAWPRSGPPPAMAEKSHFFCTHSLVASSSKRPFFDEKKKSKTSPMQCRPNLNSIQIFALRLFLVSQTRTKQGQLHRASSAFLSYVQSACAASDPVAKTNLEICTKTLLCCCGDEWPRSSLNTSDVLGYVFYALCASVMCYAMRWG